MLKTMKLLAVLFTATILFSLGSCGENTAAAASDPADISNAIPADATGVFLVNTKQLLEKADYASLKETSFFKDWIKQAKERLPAMVPFLEDPEASGINMTSNMGFFFSIPKEMKAPKDIEFAFMLPIADKAKVDAAVVLALKDIDNPKTETKSDYTITTLKFNSFLIQSDKILAITTYDDEAKVKELIHPTGENIHSNANFKKHQKESKDMLFWMNGDPLFAMLLKNAETKMQLRGALGVAQVPDEALKGNFMSLFYDFQKGKMNVGTQFDFSDILVRELGEVFPAELAIDYSKYIPTENLASAMTFGINSAGVLNFMVKRGLDETVDNFLENSGLDLGKIKDGITGGLTVAVYAPTDKANDPAIVLALGLKDKVFMEGVLGLAGNKITKNGDKYVFTGQKSMMDPTATPMQFFAVLKDDVMLISNSNASIDKASSASAKNEVIGALQTGWMGIFVDYNVINDNFDVIANYLPMDPASFNMSKMMSEYQSIATVKVIAKGNTVMGETMMKDTETNSLKSLLQSLGKMSQDKAKVEKELQGEFDDFDDFDEELKETEKNT